MKLNMTILNNLAKALEDLPKAKVGVLGGNAAREGMNNAEIGLRHEFGYGVPKRSFLREPLISNFQKDLDGTGLDGQTIFKQAAEEGSLVGLVRKIGMIGEQTVRKAFQSGGDGKWAPHAPGYTNNTGMILIDTQQLRNSISSEVS